MHALRGLVAGKLCQRCRRVWRDVADHGFDVDFADVAQGAPAQAFLHKFGPRYEGAAALAGALKTNTALTTLNLLENNIGHEGAAALAGALKTNAALTTLILSWNNNTCIGDEGAAALAGALKTNRNPTSDEFRAKCRAKGWYYLSAASHACVRGSPPTARAKADAKAKVKAAKAQEVREEAEKARAKAAAEEEEAAKAQEVREEAEKARAQREQAEEEEAAKAQEVREEAEKANARREEEEATKAEEAAAAAAAAAAEQRAAAKAARMRHLHKFLGAANSEEYFDKLTNYGIESVEDLCLATADDLAEAGVTKPFHRRKLLAAAAKWSKNSGQTESDTIILSKITEHMRTGDNHLAEDECAVARDAYATALSMAQELKLTNLVTVLDWKVYKADFCLGAAVLPLSGSGTEDATCGIPALANELLLSDFAIAASRFGFRRVQHWDEWFKLFGLTQQSCSPKALKRSYYRGMVKYHPDKFNGPQHCATMMALILNAGKELLDSHSACANEREL